LGQSKKCLREVPQGKKAEILQEMFDHRTQRRVDVALEHVLMFQPPTFFGKAEQDQWAE
jgi:hypothetical protein